MSDTVWSNFTQRPLIKEPSGETTFEQLYDAHSLVVRCKQIWLKSTKLNHCCLTQGGGGQRTGGVQRNTSSNISRNRAVENAEVISPLHSTWHIYSTGSLWERTAVCIRGAPERETGSARVSVKGALGDGAASNLEPSHVAENRSQQEDSVIW